MLHSMLSKQASISRPFDHINQQSSAFLNIGPDLVSLVDRTYLHFPRRTLMGCQITRAISDTPLASPTSSKPASTLLVWSLTLASTLYS
jgi:hypothetical protein